MNKTAFLGWVLLGGISCFGAGCSSDTKNNKTGSGGQSSSGGSTSNSTSTSSGGSTTTTASTGGGSSLPPLCDVGDAGSQHITDGDGGRILSQVGATDPSKSIPLDVGGFFTSGDNKGYCFTYGDNHGSTISPICGTSGGECFTKNSGLCTTAHLGVASTTIWGAGIGCALNQKSASGASANPISLVGKTGITVEIYGCKTPKQLRLQLNIDNPTFDDAGTLGSGYYCSDVFLTTPDADGARTGTVDLSKLRQDCWTGTGPLLDTSTLNADSIQVQINADQTNPTDWDFCISKLSVD